jgi:hypothetical protein
MSEVRKKAKTKDLESNHENTKEIDYSFVLSPTSCFRD